MSVNVLRLLICAALLALTGCASITGGTTQQMFVQVKESSGAPVDAAECVLVNDKGTWNVRPPSGLTVSRSNKAIQIKCTRASLPDGGVSVDSTTRAAMFGNILFGGVIGVGIDHVSGAAYEYPGIATVVMGQNAQLKMAYAPGGAVNGPTVAARLIPAPTRFAAIGDVAAVPGLSDRGREMYRAFLTKKSPRAFAVGPDQHFAFSDGLRPRDTSRPSDPSVRALEVCSEYAKTQCRLYAVDDAVVYVAPSPKEASAPAVAAPVKSRYALPSETQFADLNDSTLVPVNEDGRGKYLQFLTLPSPKAFAIKSDGGWVTVSNSGSAMADVLNTCEREGKSCWLYAVDDRVVWTSDLNKRIGHVNQLVAAAKP